MRRQVREQTEVNVQLFVTGFKCSPNEITRILGIPPTKAWVKGDPIIRSASAVRRWNGWKIEAPPPKTTSPEAQTKALLARIMPRAERFKHLPPGADVHLSCAIYAYDDSQRVFEFSAKAVRELARIGAPISIAYYDFTHLRKRKGVRRQTK